MIILKSDHEIEQIRQACRLAADTLEHLIQAVRPGITTKKLDEMAEAYIRAHGGTPSCKGYYGYPATICASVNDQVVHGIPNKYALKSGDIISIDLVANFNGFHGDSAVTVPVGRVPKGVMKLLEVTEESLFKGIEQAQVGHTIGHIGHAVQTYAEAAGYGVVRDFTGHGIGRDMHEDPPVPNFGRPGEGPRLEPGMVICIEPMINRGTWKVEVLSDNWTTVTCDGKESAHFEHTVLITEEGPEILTLRSEPRLITGNSRRN